MTKTLSEQLEAALATKLALTELTQMTQEYGGYDAEFATPVADRALKGLYGSGDVDRDTKRRNTAKSMIQPPTHQRPQEIYTPEDLLEPIRELWADGIALDPCSGPGSIVGAKQCYFGKHVGPDEVDGLMAPWLDRTFVNPPYGELKQWLAKCMKEAAKGLEIIALVPVRTHRFWFRGALSEASAVRWLNPVTFRGFKAAFPVPLALIYWGPRGYDFLRLTDVLVTPKPRKNAKSKKSKAVPA